ncbi:MAG: Holliday junction branch migration protein RuvA [Acidimicrobiales bacterium]
MIGSLRGILLERAGDNELLVEVAGVGYRVTVTPTTVVEAGEPGDEVFLYIHHHRRDDLETLYGFLSRDERVCFEALIGAHGVGPTLALAILAVHSPPALQRVLLDDDLSALCLVPGVGKKTAARLLVELKSRLDLPGLEQAATASSATGASGAARVGRSARADVREALTNLGYGPDEVSEVIRELPDDGDVSQMLKVALQRLAVS